MAIHQKLVLTQRLEDVEMASEMRNTPRRTRDSIGGKDASGRTAGMVTKTQFFIFFEDSSG